MTSGCIGQVYFCDLLLLLLLLVLVFVPLLHRRAIEVNRPYLRGDICRERASHRYEQISLFTGNLESPVVPFIL